jgi:hypothetical protein
MIMGLGVRGFFQTLSLLVSSCCFCACVVGVTVTGQATRLPIPPLQLVSEHRWGGGPITIIDPVTATLSHHCTIRRSHLYCYASVLSGYGATYRFRRSRALYKPPLATVRRVNRKVHELFI